MSDNIFPLSPSPNIVNALYMMLYKSKKQKTKKQFLIWRASKPNNDTCKTIVNGEEMEMKQ